MGALRCRIDDRLLHAEVLYGELEGGTFDQLVVASRLGWIESVDTSLVPPGVEAAVVAPGEVAARLTGGRSLVVLGTPADLVEALDAGLAPGVVVLANRARRPGARRLGTSYWADPDELRLLRTLLDAGLRLILQRVPAEAPQRLDRAQIATVVTDDPNPHHGTHDATD